jgi:hypothetical protein
MYRSYHIWLPIPLKVLQILVLKIVQNLELFKGIWCKNKQLNLVTQDLGKNLIFETIGQTDKINYVPGIRSFIASVSFIS